MIPTQIAGATHILGAPKDWDQARDGVCVPLPIRRTEDGMSMSAWRPDPVELAALNQGADVVLSIVGGQPPVMLTVETGLEPQTDWRSLLVRYMARVIDCEGESFVRLTGHTVVLTAQEEALLEQIETEAMRAGVSREGTGS